MINKSLFLLFFLFPSLEGYGQSLTAVKYSSGGYVVYGSVDSNMLVKGPDSIRGTFHVAVYEGGTQYSTYNNGSAERYCPDYAEGAAKFINDRLAQAPWARDREGINNINKAWLVTVSCKIGPNKTWRTGTTVPSPPDAAKCSITYPGTVSFGNVTRGTQKDVNAAVKITCNKLADITVGFSKQTVNLGDAVVNYYFPDNKKSYLMRANENIPASFNMRFSLENTGETLGYKSGDAVMIFNWQ